ncbi:MAG: hypothetical protein K8F91_26565, partial [Candidatus Obscuribacterales bacterium]|nr:hypothetical protein [Candidatus Obscuribacterales bacterium]
VDSMLLEQVIVNLLDNSLKYAPDSSYKLKAWSEDGAIIFEVHNDGEAIAREKQELVFEKFYRKDGDTRGSGLGLAICKSILALHEGRIWVVPDVEKGVSFRISLPACGEQIDMPSEAPEEPS